MEVESWALGMNSRSSETENSLLIFEHYHRKGSFSCDAERTLTVRTVGYIVSKPETTATKPPETFILEPDGCSFTRIKDDSLKNFSLSVIPKQTLTLI